jgi:hypothetical protein
LSARQYFFVRSTIRGGIVASQQIEQFAGFSGISTALRFLPPLVLQVHYGEKGHGKFFL